MTKKIAPKRTTKKVPAKQGKSKDYEVGYKKPPKHSQWKPGQSGNPAGRKPVQNSAELNALIDQIFAETITEGKVTMDKLSIAVNNLLFNKNPSGAIYILDRRFGKVSQNLILANDPDNPLVLKISDEQRLEEMKKLAPAIAAALAKQGVKK